MARMRTVSSHPAGNNGRRRPSAFPPLAGLAIAAAAVLSGCSNEPPQGGPIPVKVELGGLGDSPGRFMLPRAIAADEQDGTLWVVDKSARIQRLDPETGECLGIWQMPLSEAGKPVGLTIGPTLDGRPGLWIPDTHYHRVMVMERPVGQVAESGPARIHGDVQPVTTFGEFGTGPGQFTYPTDIALLTDKDGQVERIYVAEYGGNDRVSVFNRDLEFLFTFGTFGYGGADPNAAAGPDGQTLIYLDRPQSMDFDPATGELIIADSRNHRLGRFTPDGELIAWIGSPETSGTGPGQLRYPYGLALLGDGTALVVEYGNNRLQRLDLVTGESLGIWGVPGRGDGELASPWAVAVLGRMAYIVDGGNNRVLGMTAPTLREGSPALDGFVLHAPSAGGSG